MTEPQEFPAWEPWSCEAEQSLLGCLLLDNDAAARVAGLVDAASFWHAPHRRIFDAVQALIGASQPADVVTVYQALRDAGHADEAGGLSYLTRLSQCVPSAGNAPRYAAIVADKALRRRVLAAAAEVPELAKKANTADQALDQAQTLMAGIKRLQAGSEPRPIGELMVARTGHWEALDRGDAAPGIPTGLSSLDKALGGGIKPGRVIVLAARTSVGKTSLASQILLAVARQGHPALMLSQEMTADELMDRAAAHLAGIPMDRLSTGRFQADDWERVSELVDTAARLQVYVDDQPALSLVAIRAKARQVKRQTGGRLALLVVDYLQLCATSSTADKRHHQIEQLSRGMKTLAKELGTTVLLLSQLSRLAEEVEPELHHLKESGSIEEDADTVVLLDRTDKVDEAGRQVCVAKVAKNRGGMRGRLALNFDGATQRWAESNADVHPQAAGVGARGGRR